MKQYFLFISVSVLFAVFTIGKYNPIDVTQLVVTIPELSTLGLKEKLELDFNNMKGVSKCETSLMTKTMLMTYDSREVSPDAIKSVFQKWGCIPEEYSYQKLYLNP